VGPPDSASVPAPIEPAHLTVRQPHYRATNRSPQIKLSPSLATEKHFVEFIFAKVAAGLFSSPVPEHLSDRCLLVLELAYFSLNGQLRNPSSPALPQAGSGSNQLSESIWLLSSHDSGSGK
jgi:hypothetical protein